jgi:hypothetical protein
MNKDEALQQALDALTDFDYDKRMSAIETIKNMKPCPSCGGDCGYTKKKGCQYQSGKREWVGLTEDEIHECLQGLPTQTIDVYARRIEAKLKEKNT